MDEPLNENFVEIELSDGCISRWALNDADAEAVCAYVESIVGFPDTFIP